MDPAEVPASLFETFEKSEISNAKEVLWQHVGLTAVIGEKQQRRTSVNRAAVEADAEDLVEAITKLMAANELPSLHKPATS